jgi:hypothetical protein
MTRFIRWAVMFFVLISLVVPAFSQSRNTGEIRGTVSAAGAVVAGATVTLTNIDTGETQNFVTNQDGIYDTVSTRAGNYKISVTAKGFKTTVIGPFTLQVDTITENAALDVGAVSETINVEAGGVPLLDRDRASGIDSRVQDHSGVAADRGRSHGQRLGEFQCAATGRKRLRNATHV